MFLAPTFFLFLSPPCRREKLLQRASKSRLGKYQLPRTAVSALSKSKQNLTAPPWLKQTKATPKMPFRIRHVIFNRSSITVDIYNVPGRLYFLEICPSWTSLLRIGLLLILMYCPSRTFISGWILIR